MGGGSREESYWRLPYSWLAPSWRKLTRLPLESVHTDVAQLHVMPHLHNTAVPAPSQNQGVPLEKMDEPKRPKKRPVPLDPISIDSPPLSTPEPSSAQLNDGCDSLPDQLGHKE